MNEENELAKLEGIVSNLLEKFNSLQNANKELTERLQSRDASIVGLEDEIASMKDERGEISSRVSGLIGKIEEWESATVAVEQVADDEETRNDPNPDFEPDVEDIKKDSGIQGNLFSVESTGE
jgi:chromosome segregation ATPase